MNIRPALFLMNAAGSLVPPGAGGGSPITPAEVLSAQPPTANEKPSDKAADKLRAEWKGKRYAELAAHHQALLQSGQADDAAEFHAAVVKTFKDKK